MTKYKLILKIENSTVTACIYFKLFQIDSIDIEIDWDDNNTAQLLHAYTLNYFRLIPLTLK